MHLYQRELKRVLKFCEGLGLKVQFIDGRGADYWGAYMEPDRSTPGVIEIVRASTVTHQIITLLHEIGHHLDFTQTKWMPDAYNHIDDLNPPEWARKAIFNAEERAVTNGEKAYWTLMLRIPYWKVKRELDRDIYVYKTWSQTCVFPTHKEQNDFRKKWDKKYKKHLLNIHAYQFVEDLED